MTTDGMVTRIETTFFVYRCSQVTSGLLRFVIMALERQTRVGRVGRHIKPNNFSIIYLRRMKNSADQKKTVITYLLLTELSDVCEKKYVSHRYLQWLYNIFSSNKVGNIFWIFRAYPKADAAYIRKINDWIRIMEWIKAL